MTDKIPVFRSPGMQTVPEELYAAMVTATIRTTGAADEEAEAAVDAVLSVLFLLPPAPPPPPFTDCPHMYFSEAGEWLFCAKDHEEEDEDEDEHDPHGHRSRSDQTWSDDEGDPRALLPEQLP